MVGEEPVDLNWSKREPFHISDLQKRRLEKKSTVGVSFGGEDADGGRSQPEPSRGLGDIKVAGGRMDIKQAGDLERIDMDRCQSGGASQPFDPNGRLFE